MPEVILIQNDNWFVHVFNDVEEMRKSNNVGSSQVGLQMFDPDGYRLTPVYENWQLVDLHRGPGLPNPDGIRNQLIEWVTNVRGAVWSASDDTLIGLGVDPADIPTVRDEFPRLPDLTGLSLQECFNRLMDALGHGGGGTLGGPSHMLAHALGNAHP